MSCLVDPAAPTHLRDVVCFLEGPVTNDLGDVRRVELFLWYEEPKDGFH